MLIILIPPLLSVDTDLMYLKYFLYTLETNSSLLYRYSPPWPTFGQAPAGGMPTFGLQPLPPAVGLRLLREKVGLEGETEGREGW